MIEHHSKSLFPWSWPWINLLTLELVSDLTTPSPGLWSHRWGLVFTVRRERASFSSLQQGQSGVTSEWTSWTFTWLYVPLSLSSPPCRVPALCSTPLLSDRAVYSGYVGWGVLFSRASCFAAAPEFLFLFQISRDVFGLEIWVCVYVCSEGKNCLASVSHEAINHQQTLKWHAGLSGRLGFRSDTHICQ